MSYLLSYKKISPWKRLILLGLLGSFLPSYYFWNDLSLFWEEDNTLSSKKTNLINFLKNSKKEKNNLKALQEKKAEMEKSLSSERANLPQDFLVDEILREISQLAQEAQVSLLSFTPEKENLLKAPFYYGELGISLETHGSFGNLMQFFDLLVHMSTLSRIDDVKLTKEKDSMKAKLQLIIFRSLQKEEIFEVRKNEEEENKKNTNKKKG